eukprot:gene11665-12870_t
MAEPKQIAVFDCVNENVSKFSEEKFDEALSMVKYLFNLDFLREEQVLALKQFFKGANIYSGAPTGFGKALVFQAIPVVADILIDELPGTIILIIICSLVSLMLDQVESLKRNGFNAAVIYQGQDENILSDIENGLTSHVFASPESMMSLGRCGNMVNSYAYALVCTASVAGRY